MAFVTIKSKPPHYENILEDYYRCYLIYVIEGCLSVQHNDMVEEINSGQGVALRVGSQFKLFTGKQGYQGIAVAKEGEYEGPFKGKSFVFFANPLLSQFFQLASAELLHPTLFSKQILDSLGESILHLVFRDHFQSKNELEQSHKAKYWANCVAQAIDGAVFTPKSVEDILSNLKPSYRQLSRYMKEDYGETPKAYQLRRKLEEACKLLNSGRFNITYIAYELGFPSTQHFSSTFKKMMGVNPKDWKPKTI